MTDVNEIRYQMGYGADEFGKVLNGQFSGERSAYRCAEVERHHWRIVEPGADLELTIRVAEQPPRKLGLFKLPVLEVVFCFVDTAEDGRERFFHRFHQYFHKGGG